MRTCVQQVGMHTYRSSRRLLIAVSLLSVGALAYTSAGPSHASPTASAQLSKEVLHLNGRFEFEKIVELGMRHDWPYGGDPEVLMTYSRALLETGKEVPDTLRTPKAKRSVALFVGAHTDLVRGRIAQAESVFWSLTKSADAKAWGYIGLLEQSAALRDFPAMRQIIAEFRTNSDLENLFPWVVPHYTTFRLSALGKYRELAELLKAPGVVRHLRGQDVALLRSDILVRNNEFAEAHAVVDREIAKSGLTADLVYAKATITSAERGLRASSKYLRASQKLLPRAWVLEFHAVLHETEARIMSPTQTAHKLVGLGFERTFDAAGTIGTASLLEDLVATPVATALIEQLNLADEDLRRYATYHIWFAKAHLKERRTESMDLAVRRAIETDPANSGLLWLQYEIARTNRNHVGAIEVLSRMLELDPHNKSAMRAATRVYEDAGQLNDVITMGRRFLESKRAIGAIAEKDVRDRVQRATELMDKARK